MRSLQEGEAIKSHNATLRMVRAFVSTGECIGPIQGPHYTIGRVGNALCDCGRWQKHVGHRN